MKKLDNEIGHFYSFYEHIDTIKLKLLMFLKLDDLDMAEMSFEKGKFIMDGSEIMSLDNVKMVADNTSLKYWYNELENTEKEYFRLKAIYSKDKSDAELCRKYADVAAKRSSILKEIEDTEKILFEKSLNLIRDSAKGEMTARQREAYRLLEEGDLEGANAVLDFEEIKNDFHRKMEIRKQEDKHLASIHINELKSKIDILDIMTEYQNRFNDIVECYEEIMAVSFEYGAEYDVVRQYAVFLDDCGYSTKAYGIIKKLENIYDREEVDIYYKAAFYNTAGNTANHISGMHKETEEYFTKAIEIREKLAQKDPDRYEPDLARSYNNAGALYYAQGQSKKAEEYFTKAIEIREKLAQKDPDRYEPDLARSYNNAGVFYDNLGQSKKTEEYYTKAIDIYERQAKKDPDRYEPDLAASYNNASDFYNNQGQSKKAEKYHKKAIDIREKLAKKNPDRYEPDLATSYFNYGIFTKNKKYFEKALLIAKKNPQNPYCRQILCSFGK